jgi:indole-3-glycerol phosphate synthase
MSDLFVTTGTILDDILTHKLKEIAVRSEHVALSRMRDAAAMVAPPRGFVGMLRQQTVALIAEVKHASPSKGVLIDPFDPVDLGSTYAANGAAAISVLTDEYYFQGHLEHLSAVRNAVEVPVLRKDFILDPFQVYEGRAAGADAMLLIAAALTDSQLVDLHTLILDLGMAALVEVHNEAEMERALAIDAPLIGVNNRDLRTFEVSLETTATLASQLPTGVTLVAESGIRTEEDVQRMGKLGAHAVLVGESLVTAGDGLAARVRSFASQPRQFMSASPKRT